MLSPICLDAHNPGPLTGRGNHTYLVIGSDGSALLVDAGVGDVRHLTEIEHALEPHHAALELVLITHAHRDHAGGVSSLAARHPRASFVKYPWPSEDGRHGVRWQAIADGQSIGKGEERLTAVYTPGHSPDHVVFWHEASRTVFSGDLVIKGWSVTIAWSRGGDLTAYLASLQRVMALEPRTLLPAHGPAITDPAQVLNAYLEHRRARERQVIAALQAGHSTVQTIADSIYHGLDPALMAAAHENVRAHLEKLRTDGTAVADGDERWRL